MKINGGIQWWWCIKNRDSGPSLLEVMYHQHLDGMHLILLTVHMLYTNAALPRISGDLIYNT